MQTAIKENTATITLELITGEVRSYSISGDAYGDLETGAFKIENKNGSKFLFLPNPEFHTGKRKRRLKLLHNL